MLLSGWGLVCGQTPAPEQFFESKDHKRLTYRHAGRDFRLTDVHGEVVDKILA